jgi:hypothetical protein
MLRAVRAVVHDGFTPEQAYEVYETVKRESAGVPAAR